MEDLQGGYAAPPNMDPEHEQRLKMLQLMQAAAATTSVPLASLTGGIIQNISMLLNIYTVRVDLYIWTVNIEPWLKMSSCAYIL